MLAVATGADLYNGLGRMADLYNDPADDLFSTYLKKLDSEPDSEARLLLIEQMRVSLLSVVKTLKKDPERWKG